MSERPPFRHLDFSPVAGLVVTAAVVASVLLGADGPVETAAGVALAAAPVVWTTLRLRRLF